MNMTLFVREFTLAVFNYKKALEFIFKHKLQFYYVAPLLVGILFIIVGFTGASIVSDWMDGLFQQWFGVTIKDTSFDILKDYKDFFSTSGSILITVMLNLLVFFIVFRINKYVTLIILSPVLAYLSEKVDTIITGNEYPFEVKQFVKDVWRGVILAFRNMFIEFSFVIGLWIITFFIPILFPFTAIILFFVSAYYYGFAMIDYSNERKRLNMKDSIHYIRMRKGLTLGNGIIYQILVSIPFFGAIVAPITAVVAATLSVHEMEEKGM